MAFKGLFIGIDRYGSPEINWLSCASRDAKALHGLFTDTLGGDTTLLTDEQATVAAIRQRFEELATCDAEDVVIIAFSGHGTETHELVGHDTDPYDLPRTTLPLTTLGEWCSRIPSRRLLLVLDCCFSGGMGAKALQVEAVPRDIRSVDGKLNQISGEGRVVLTASGPTQKAWAVASIVRMPKGPLQERMARLLLRLDLGIQGPAVDLARYAGRDLGRADYRRLCDGRLTDREALFAVDDATLLRLMGNDARKLVVVREAVRQWRAARPASPPAPAVPPYQQ